VAKLTETKIKAGRPRERLYKVFDANGLYLAVAPAGGRWWRVRLMRDGRPQHLSRGTYPEVGLEDARARAAQLRAGLKNGGGPATAALAAEMRGAKPRPVKLAPASDALEKVAERWLARQQQKLAAITFVRDQRCVGYLTRELGPRTPLGEITTPILREAIQRIETRGGETARRSLKLANAIWRFAMNNGFVNVNPASGLKSQEVLAPIRTRNFAAIKEPKALGGLSRATWFSGARSDVPLRAFEPRPAGERRHRRHRRVRERRRANLLEWHLDGAERPFLTAHGRGTCAAF
jgi:hypothetical protein